MVLSVRTSKPKTIVAALQKFCPELIKDADEARRELKELQMKELKNHKERMNSKADREEQEGETNIW